MDSEIFKSILSLSVSLITLGLGWFVGLKLTHQWNLRQKQKELDLLNAKEFQTLYGEFFAIWKLWNYYKRDIGESKLPGASRWELLKRSCDAEALMEATFIRFSSEYDLSAIQVNSFGAFRQLYQKLRESIRDDRPLKWDYSDHLEYIRFKELACKLNYFIISGGKDETSIIENRAKTLKEITSNIHEIHKNNKDPIA